MGFYRLTNNRLETFLFCLTIFFGVIFSITFVKLQLKVLEQVQGDDVLDHEIFYLKNDTEIIVGTAKSVIRTPQSEESKSKSSSFSTLTRNNDNKESSTTADQNNTNFLLIPTNNITINNNESHNNHEDVIEFQRQEGVVIVTKVHGPHQLALLKQSMCLLRYAYNSRVNYDIVLFTTLPIRDNETLLVDIRNVLKPAIITVVLDNIGIVNEIHKLSPIRRQKFLQRCNVTSPDQITWDSVCYEEGFGSRISYNWQAEFRSWHIWRHQSLQRYRYMMWLDTDAFCTQKWDRDPIAIAIKNQMVIYFDNYPQGRAKAAQSKVKEVFGKYLCGARKLPNGQMSTTLDDTCGGSQLWTLHGFFHITDLDFFRQKQVIHWAETMIGDCFLCRQFDDQLAVTVPTFVLAPERSWDMYKSGVELKIFHNNKIDGKRNKKAGGFLNYWNDNAERQFPEAWNKCEITEGS